jgi:ankyrin repeat protein
VQNLLAQKKNPNWQDENGKTGLSWAAGKPDTNIAARPEKIYEQIVALLLHNPHCPERTINPGHTQYDPSCSLCICANPNSRDNKGKTPLHWAAGDARCLEIVQLLLAASADPNAEDYEGRHPLDWAASFGCYAIASELLHHGAHVDTQNPCTKKTALQWAAGNGFFEIVTLLLSYGADPLSVDCAGQTPLFWAKKSGGPAVVTALMKAIEARQAQQEPLQQSPQQAPETPSATQATISPQLAALNPLDRLMAILDGKR